MKTKPKPESDANIVTLRDLCAELKVADPYDARVKLRAIDPKKYPALAKSHKAKAGWSWEKGSAALREAREVIASKPVPKGKKPPKVSKKPVAKSNAQAAEPVAQAQAS